jgi:transposase
MNAVGIDVSKGKSMAAAINRLSGEVTLAPREFAHTVSGLRACIYDTLIPLGGEIRVVMEATGRYHEPVVSALRDAGVYVSVVNPILIRGYGNNSVRRVKTDRKDALKIARYGLDNWNELRECVPDDALRQQLKLVNRQYNLYMKTYMSLQNNLVSLLDKTFPGVEKMFTSPARGDGRTKWVDFVKTFYHAGCVSRVREADFAALYKEWCARNNYNFNPGKAAAVHALSRERAATLPMDGNSRLLVTSAADKLTNISVTLASLKGELARLASMLPEHGLVTSLFGAGPLTSAQLMAEIGDVRRFGNRNALVAFAGVDPTPFQSGNYESKSSPTSKRGSPHLRRTLFQVVSVYLKRAPADEPVYRFLERKRAEGKPYFVYMTAAANKFLRIYYARAKEYLLSLDEAKNGARDGLRDDA